MTQDYPFTERTRLELRYEIHGQPHWIKHLLSFDACQRIYISLRDESGLGASQFGTGQIFDEQGQYIAQVSYNGRLWPALPWTPNLKPLAEAPRP